MAIVLNILLTCLNVLGVNSLFRLINRHKAMILWYHGVRGDETELPELLYRLHIRESKFRKQLSYVKHLGYSFVSMSELAERIKAKQEIGRLVVLTFDDGYENVVSRAYPIMRELAAKGCMYVVEGLPGTGEMLWTDYVAANVAGCEHRDPGLDCDDQSIRRAIGRKAHRRAANGMIKRLRQLPSEERKTQISRLEHVVPSDVVSALRIASPEQLRSLDKDVLEIGSHTRSHGDCTYLLSESEFEDELGESKQRLGRMAGYAITHFCYPFGPYNQRVVAHVGKSGYRTAVTTVPGLVNKRSDLLTLSRIGATEDMLLFKAMISGTILIPLRMFAWARQVTSLNTIRKRAK